MSSEERAATDRTRHRPDKGSAPIQREVRIAARPETIFEFFIDPKKMVRWKGASALLDAHPGGVYRVVIRDEVVALGAYVELVPPSRVVFTWGWEGENSVVPPGTSTVEVDLIPDGTGTIVRLTHHQLPDSERDIHAAGWEHYLARLAQAAVGTDPGPDPHAAPPGT